MGCSSFFSLGCAADPFVDARRWDVDSLGDFDGAV
jgi:hypothetical protein